MGHRLILAIYFLSGFAALLYQVIWQRMLAIFSGADLFATTTIVAAFMAGLGVGSLAGGALADRMTVRRQVLFFAAAEFVTGGFGLMSKWWYYDVLYHQFPHLANSGLMLAAVLFLSLLLPTFCMGLTLPLLSKAITPAVELAGRRIGSLYALNTLGAAAGALTTSWLLMGRLDFPTILRVGAAINFAAGAWALIVWRTLTDAAAEEDGSPAPAMDTSFGVSSWLLIYGLSGFLALSWEIVWFRVLGVILKSNSFTFPHLLGVYLICLAAGIYLGAKLVRYVVRHTAAFLVLQSAVVLYCGTSIALLALGLDDIGILEWLQQYVAGYNPLDVSPPEGNDTTRFFPAFVSEAHFGRLYLLLPFALIGPPTLMMGLSFPFLQAAVQNSRTLLGRRVGMLQAANILGATLGAVVVGALSIEFLGTSWTLRLLVALGSAFVLLAIRHGLRQERVRRMAYAVSVVFVVALLIAIPGSEDLWARFHGSPAEHLIANESGSGVSILKNVNAQFSDTTWVYTNGLGQSWVPYHHVSVIHSRLGFIPSVLHPAPRDIAVIGLGSGDTLFSVAGREETKEVTCIEIIGAQLDGLRRLHEKQPYGGLETLLNDRRFQYEFADGRRFIAASSRKYDIIQADALRATSAFAGNLYSQEYFRLLKSRLKPGGFAVTWAPTARVLETFLTVFPHVLNFDSILIGSEQEIPFNPEVVKARANHAFTQAHFKRAGLDAEALISPFYGKTNLRLYPGPHRRKDLNSDLLPRDEYAR